MNEAGWRLAAFTGSWRAPRIARLRWIAVPDAAARVQAVLADQMDIALGLGPDEVAAIEAGGGKGATWRTAVNWALQYHQAGRDGPFNDRRVREALNLAVDRRALVDGLLAGTTIPATQPATQGTYGYNPDLPPIPHDPARARALLAEAGYPDGFKFTLQAVVGAGPADGAVFQKIAQDLAAVGVTMEIRQFPVPELIRAVTEGSWSGDAFAMSFANEQNVDALRSMQNHSCLWPHPWYCDERIMPVILAAQTEFDPERALRLRHEVMRFYREDYMALFLYELPRFAGLRADVHGFEEVHGFINVDRITKGE
jgi:ABC-type transport system substrate-binding protein